MTGARILVEAAQKIERVTLDKADVFSFPELERVCAQVQGAGVQMLKYSVGKK